MIDLVIWCESKIIIKKYNYSGPVPRVGEHVTLPSGFTLAVIQIVYNFHKEGLLPLVQITLG